MTDARLITGDARVVLADLPAESVDCVIADPPYGETSLTWDRWPDGWPTAVLRVLKPTGSMWVFGSLRMFLRHRDEFDGWAHRQEIVWEKHNGSNAAADRFRRVHELVVQYVRADQPASQVYTKPVFSLDSTARTVRRKQRPAHWGEIGAPHYVSEDGGPRLMRSVIYCRSEHGRAIHPTQKPVDLVGLLIEHSCPPSGTVLSPFGGSGTDAIAAQRAGCRSILVETDPFYVAAAERRLAGVTLGLPLGAA